MGKYIIELKKGETAYKTVDSNGTPMIQLLGPIPYFAPNIEQVREEAKEEGYRIGYDEGREAGVQQGLADAWEAARKIWKYDTTTLKAIFGEGIMRMDWFMKFTASEAIEKLKAYEQRQKEIKVGDEVRNINGGWTAVVSAIDRECMTLMDTNGKLGDGYDMNRFIKTGRHFPEIATVLEKMKEE